MANALDRLQPPPRPRPHSHSRAINAPDPDDLPSPRYRYTSRHAIPVLRSIPVRAAHAYHAPASSDYPLLYFSLTSVSVLHTPPRLRASNVTPGLSCPVFVWQV